MTTLKKAVKNALLQWDDDGWIPDNSIQALRKALADEQAQAVEPLAWVYDWYVDALEGDVIKDWFSSDYDEAHSPTMGCHNIRPLFTHPVPPAKAQAVEPTTVGAEDKWKKLALEFDWQRMQAHAHLRAMTLNPYTHMAEAMKFMAAPPTKAQQVAVPFIKQESLGASFAKVLHENLWDLYETEAQQVAAPATGERAELISKLRNIGYPECVDAADMLEADCKAQQVSAPELLAAWLQWCLDNCDDSPEYNFGTTATEHMRALLAGKPAPMPPAQGVKP